MIYSGYLPVEYYRFRDDNGGLVSKLRETHREQSVIFSWTISRNYTDVYHSICYHGNNNFHEQDDKSQRLIEESSFLSLVFPLHIEKREVFGKFILKNKGKREIFKIYDYREVLYDYYKNTF